MKKLLFSFISAIFFIPLQAQDFALDQLENSPRHHEWVEVTHDNRTVHSFVAYPEISENTLAVIVIHENRGLTDWVRSFADQLAGAGFIAIAPDLLSGFSGEYGKTSDFPSSDDARNAIYQLDPARITADLQAVQDYAANLDAGNGQTAVMGFCWGGSQTFRFATNNDEIKAALVFYGSAPEEMEAVKNIAAPVYGFYGENDQRINSGIPDIEQMMQEADKTYKYEIYTGVGHAFMRQGDDPNASATDKAAWQKAWSRTVNILNNYK